MDRDALADGRPRGDGGSATVWAMAAGLVFVLVSATLALAGAATVARHRAQVAADLAALGAALLAFDGPDLACARAADLSTRNGARLVACRLEGLDAIVTVDVAIVGGGRWGSAQASARAGPVDQSASIDRRSTPASDALRHNQAARWA